MTYLVYKIYQPWPERKTDEDTAISLPSCRHAIVEFERCPSGPVSIGGNTTPDPPDTIISCGMLEAELEYLLKHGISIVPRYLEPTLHVNFDKLKAELSREWKRMVAAGAEDLGLDFRNMFGDYRAVLVLDTGISPIDEAEVEKFSAYANLPVERMDVSLDNLWERVRELL
jgi:hypothetical protein